MGELFDLPCNIKEGMTKEQVATELAKNIGACPAEMDGNEMLHYIGESELKIIIKHLKGE